MAAWNFGALSIRPPNLDIESSGSKLAASQSVHVPQRRRLVRNRSLNVTKWSEKAFIGCKCLSKAETAVTKVADGSKEAKSSTMSQPDLNSFEVESLLSRICDTTSVAEFELKLGGFKLYVKRNLAGKSESSAQAAPNTASVNTTVETPDPNGSATSPSLALSKPVTSSGGIQSYLNAVADEGLMILQSPKVGYFRRSRTIKGKRVPPPCKEKQTVKEGQVLCYIEQLGGEVPIESDVSGEVIKILREDGEPVGYGDALITVLPSFPGIKKLQ